MLVLFIILGVIVLITFVVLGVLFFMLGKEGQKIDDKAVPVTDLKQFKKDVTPSILEPSNPKILDKDPDYVPLSMPKLSLPTQQVQSRLEEDSYKKRAEELEEELKVISQKAEGQSNEARQMIETLTKENESLKNQQADLQQAQQKLTVLQGEASILKSDNIGLQTQLEATNAKVSLLEDQMAAVKVQMGEEISRANATVAELTREKEALLSAPKAEPPDEALLQELEALKIEQFQLKQKYDELQKTQQESRDLNAQLTEKNDTLQQELIKTRAQSSAFERVSINYKNQLEGLLKKAAPVQVTNDVKEEILPIDGEDQVGV